jgi:prepilin-type N-terminal cleavage/methylation domain-containing protein
MNSSEDGRRGSEDGGQRTDVSLSCEALAKREGQLVHAKNRSGMTLVEVLLGAAILGIMAVLAVNALFYPRLLAVSSTYKQLAVQAGTGEIESLRTNVYANVVSRTNNLTSKFNLKGRSIIATDTVQTVPASGFAGYANYEYKRITVVVSYPYGNGTTNLTLVTYRSP